MTHVRKSHINLGAGGERLVARWYRDQDFDVVATNWSAHDSGLGGFERIRGELDLVVTRESLLVFVEVKTRNSAHFGTALDAVTVAKQRQVRRLARLFLQSNGGPKLALAKAPPQRIIRFDAAGLDTATSPFTLTVVADAF